MISLEKFLQEKKINFTNVGESKLNLESESSVFNLNCINASEFPLTDEDFNENEFFVNSKDLLKLLNKCKFSISNDETRHYLSGIFIHMTIINEKPYLTAAATDSHRMSVSKIKLKNRINFEPVILQKKPYFKCALYWKILKVK